MKEDKRATDGGKHVSTSKARKHVAGISIGCLGILLIMIYLISEFLEEGSLTGLLQHLTKRSLIFYHIAVFLTIPAFMLISYFYQKQKNLTENLEQIVKERTERLRKSEEKLKEYAEHLEEKVEERTRELKETQKQLIKSERLAAIGELATMVGHDLRNPLQSIENAAYYLNNELTQHPSSVPIPQKTIEMLRIITDSVNYADRIIRDLQDFSATKKPTLKKTNINAIVKDALSQVETPENIELITELGRLPLVEVDGDMMKRVFLNLVINGMQAMENGGTLKVSTKKTNGFVEVSFKDTGIGIQKEDMKKIFTPFFTTKAKGMGMGLAICKKLVESHGGNIEVKSEENKGSTFTVKLFIQQKSGGDNSEEE